MRKWITIGSAIATVVPVTSIAYGWSTGKAADWWASWGQWMGAVGSIVAAVVALWIAWWGWERAEKQRAADAKAARVERERRDLDETRRMAMAALSKGTAGEPHGLVFAAVVNALAYHSGIVAPDRARTLLEQAHAGGDQQGEIQRLINLLCDALGDPPLYDFGQSGG